MEKLFEILLSGIKPKDINLVMILLVFLAVVPNGFTFMYIHKPSLLLNLDIFKLLILSIAITCPSIVILYIVLSFFNSFKNHKTNILDLIVASSLSLIIFGLTTFFHLRKPITTLEHAMRVFELTGYGTVGIAIGAIIGKIVNKIRSKS